MKGTAIAAVVLCLTGAGVAEAAADVASLSPDGRMAVVNWPTASGERHGLALISLDTGQTEWICDDAPVTGAAWSPDGRWVVYATNAGDGISTSLFDSVTRTSRKLVRRIEPPFAWREDGRRLAGVERNDENELRVVVYNLPEAGVAHASAVDVASVAMGSMIWLPDTDDVAFIGVRGDSADVYTVEGGQARRISSTGDVLALAVGRDRRSLIWARSSKNTRYILLTLYSYDLAQRAVRRLGFPERVAAINPRPDASPTSVQRAALSPSGDRLAVVTVHPPTRPPRTGDTSLRLRLFTVRMDGTDARLVRTALKGAAADPLPAMLPFWSPDGASLGVLHAERRASALALFRADGQGGRLIARVEAPE